MKLLKALWNSFSDDRLGLLTAGVCFAFALIELKSGDYSGAAIDLTFALVIGGLAWHDLGRKVRL